MKSVGSGISSVPNPLRGHTSRYAQHSLRRRVYGTPTVLVVILTLAAVILLATTVPALRVARIDPARTLREE